MKINTSICPECFSVKFIQLPDKSWECLECKYKYKKKGEQKT